MRRAREPGGEGGHAARVPRGAAPVVCHAQAGPAGKAHRQPGCGDREAVPPHRRPRRNAQPATGGSRLHPAGDCPAGRRPHRTHQARYRRQASPESRVGAAGHAIRRARQSAGTPGRYRCRHVRRYSAGHPRGPAGNRGGAGGSAERAHRSRHGAAPIAGAVGRTGSGVAVALPQALQYSAADSGNAQRTVPHHGHQRGRHPVRRRTAASARRRARVGRRHRAAAAQFRPLATGARCALRAGGGVGGPDAPQRTPSLLPRAQSESGGSRRVARQFAGAQDFGEAGVGLLRLDRRRTGGALQLRLLRDARPIPPRTDGRHARRTDQRAWRAPRERRPPPHRRPLALRAGLEQRAEDRRAEVGPAPRGNPARAASGRHRKAEAAKGRRAGAQHQARRTRRVRELPGTGWRPLVTEIERLEGERRELEEGSDILRTLQQQLTQLEAAAKETEARLASDQRDETRAEERRAQAGELLAACDWLLAGTSEEVKADVFPRVESMSFEALGSQVLTVESCDNREREMREWVQGRIDAEDKNISRLDERIVKGMQAYRGRYPLETREADASVQAAGEYRKMLYRLKADDLPRFESAFKSLLNENTIREVANFQSQLNRERETIRERIETINRSLRGIVYNPGRYIQLEANPNADPEIRDFLVALRACTEGSLAGSDEAGYSEEKFLQVKRIIERFRGREGTGELDKRWTAKVTDVRHWFTFSASERWKR